MRADTGEGPGSEGVEVEWDFDGDGEKDSTATNATWIFKEAGPHTVTLKVTGGVFGRTTEVSKTIDLKKAAAEGGAR